MRAWIREHGIRLSALALVGLLFALPVAVLMWMTAVPGTSWRGLLASACRARTVPEDRGVMGCAERARRGGLSPCPVGGPGHWPDQVEQEQMEMALRPPFCNAQTHPSLRGSTRRGVVRRALRRFWLLRGISV